MHPGPKVQMRRFLVTGTVSLLLLLSVGVPQAQAARVYCRIPTRHRVVCYNYTPYPVHMRVVVKTTAGPRYFRFWNNRDKWRHDFHAAVCRVRWRWHF